MKYPIAISALILATAAGLCWKIDDRLTEARGEGAKLAAEASRAGISVADGPSIRGARRERVDREEVARQLAIEFDAESRKWESTGFLDSADQERSRILRQRLEALEPPLLKVIITGLLASEDLPERIRAERAVGLLKILAKKDPQAALTLFANHCAMIRTSPRAVSVISESLEIWAKDDPVAAVEWMRKNPHDIPEEMITASRDRVLHSAAEKDARLAFTLAAGFETDASDTVTALHAIVSAATTDEARNLTVVGLRDYLTAHKDDPGSGERVSQSFGHLSWGFKPDGFDAASQWIAKAGLNPKELEGFCAGLSISSELDDPARWIEWMGEVFPQGAGADPIVNLVSRWTRDDYEAAGKWLGAAAASPAKNAAIRGYAQTISKHDPETAMRWIMTLPPGEYQDSTLKQVLGNWPKDDPQGAEAFKAKHGIP